jgi:hypothetical protein
MVDTAAGCCLGLGAETGHISFIFPHLHHTFSKSNFRIRIPFSISSTITCEGLSNPCRLAISMGITKVALNFPLKKVDVTHLFPCIFEFQLVQNFLISMTAYVAV